MVQYLQNKQFHVCFSLGSNSVFSILSQNIFDLLLKLHSFLISNWLVELPVTEELDFLWQIELFHRILVPLVHVFVIEPVCKDHIRK